MSRGIKLLIAAQPTRGLDVGSIEYIHRRIIAARDAGVGVLIVSTELDEILALSDRILVMYEGQIVAFRPPTVPVEELGLLMAGAGDRTGGPAPRRGRPPGSAGPPDSAGPSRPAEPPDSTEPTAGPS